MPRRTFTIKQKLKVLYPTVYSKNKDGLAHSYHINVYHARNYFYDCADVDLKRCGLKKIKYT
jgi:hypothetical protein